MDIEKIKTLSFYFILFIIIYKIISISMSSLIILLIGIILGVYFSLKFKNYIEGYETKITSIVDLF
jgi:hypothetical protein